MIKEGLWQPKKNKNKSAYRSWRLRRSAYGEMEQYDGSYEYWLEDRADKCCLLLSIDDATGRITHGCFEQNEGVIPTFNFWQEYLIKQGKPVSIYVDKFSTYNQNQETAKDNADALTQFQRAMEQLQIEVIPANSPQAKGRVERAFRTLQNRLIKELRLKNISTIEAANEFLQNEFIPKFNEKFAVAPRSNNNLHRPLTAGEKNQLSSILARQDKRIVQNDFTVSHKKQYFQLLENQPVTVCKKDVVIVEEHLDGTKHLNIRGKNLNYKVLPERQLRTAVKSNWVLAKTAPLKPAANHPWRRMYFAKSNNKQIQLTN